MCRGRADAEQQSMNAQPMTPNEIASLVARGAITFPRAAGRRGPKAKLPRELYQKLYRAGYRVHPAHEPPAPTGTDRSRPA